MQNYVLGHSNRELRRLMLQANNLRPITTRLLREIGLARGMRVVDVGCGAGDVAMLAAEMVGPTGAVLGIDRNAAAIATARERARAAGHINIEFVEGDASEMTGSRNFDLAIGRYVLVHQSDPIALIRAATTHLRPGGAVAFHEVLLLGTWWSFPLVPLWEDTSDLINRTFRSVVTCPDAGARMVEHFYNAGVELPRLFSETPVGGGPDSPLYAWAAETFRSLLPRAEEIGLVSRDEIDIDRLEDHLRQAVTAVHSQIGFAHQHCGWARI
ncbi:class I SAM-dependent methyltransferase [Bradyrhizobium sp. STM 3557]|uniref:class I SAM-dependent methyltransferase n=1 Tax=Bradyrhizobium sp. STM 3557 TaxID=578920 RepID=UPI0038910749